MKIKRAGCRPQITEEHKKKAPAGTRALAILLCCVFLAASCLTGCGGASNESDGAKSASQQASSKPEETSAKTKTDSSAASKTEEAAEASSAASDHTAASAEQTAPTDSAAASKTAASADTSGTAASAEQTAPRLLKYIDAWDEWHTMEVDPAVRETVYDAGQFTPSEDNPQWVTYTGNEEYECLQGIDISEHQGKIDWQAVADAGYRFAFIRVGYRGYGEAGTMCEDYMAVENLQQAKAAGLYVGTYFFSQALNEKEAAEEAALAVSVIEKSGVETDLPLMYDPEIIKDDWGRANEITREQVALNTAAFRKTAENSSSCKVDIYSNLPWEHNYFDTDTMNQYDIWYADYEPLPQTPYHFTWWQYTNEGTVPGIEGLVDLDLWIR